MAAGDLYAAAQELLAACELLLSGTTGGVPGRSYVSPGAPADDCEQLTVTATALGEEVTSPLSPAPQTGHRAITGRVNLATFEIRIIRCTPTSADMGDAQEPAVLTQVAAVLYEDAWCLWNGLMAMIRRDLLFSTCTEIHFDQALANQTLGHMGGWTLTIRVALPGYVPTEAEGT